MALVLRATVPVAALALAAMAGAAHAQSLDGFSVGTALKGALLAHEAPADTGKIGTFDGYRWNKASGNTTSVTADPESDKIVFVEVDWAGGAAPAESGVPGLAFGKSSLAAIRKKFGSSGFSFKAHSMKLIGTDIISVNGYELASQAKTALMVVTALPVKDVPEVDGKPSVDTGKGTLQAVILADIDYLASIWGQERVADPKSHPVAWK
jgi:hypothetical protein